MTEWCWGFGWGDETIDLKTRSMLNLTMLAGLGKMNEWEIHCRGALNNGVTKEEIRSIIHIIGIYCGVHNLWSVSVPHARFWKRLANCNYERMPRSESTHSLILKK